MAFDHIEKAFRLRTLGKLTARELTDNVYASLAHDGEFARVSELTRRLIAGGTSDVADWLAWIEPYYNDPQWTPFWPGNINGHLEHHRKMRDSFRQVAELARAVIGGGSVERPA